MITTTVAVLCLALGAQSGQPAGAHEQRREETCVVCHGTERVLLERGVHATAGLTCVSCHGGDPTAIEAAAAHALDFHALSDPLASVASCGDCHSDVQRMGESGLRTDQLELYRLSPHGSVLFETGNPDVATCSACHGTHEILHAQDPTSSVHPLNQPATCGACHSDPERMEPYGLPTDAVELYTRSVHGRAVADGLLSSPACSDCHGHHGALPPRVENAEQVCGHCHSVVREQYQQSRHFEIDPPVQCASCHGNHLILPPSESALLGEGPGACSNCHTNPDDPARGVALGMHEDLARFEELVEATARTAREAGQRGLYLDREIGFLSDAREVLVRGRTLTHTASRADLDDLLNRGQGMVGQTEDSLGKLSRLDRDRRIFTAAFFALTIALAIMLLMYAREIRGTSSSSVRRPPGTKESGDGR